MSHDYVIGPRAQADLDEIWTYLAEQVDFQTADCILENIYEQCAMVGRQPEIGSRVGDRSPGIRFVMSGKYVIMYEIETQGIRIRRVVHGARDLSQFFGTENN